MSKTRVVSQDIGDGTVLPADLDVSADNTTADATTGHHGFLPKLGGGGTNYLRADGTWAAPSGSGAPASVDYLVGTADAGLSAEIVVGTTPGGELGGTWASPTVDATHSGSAHLQDHTHAATGQGAGGGGAAIDLTAGTLELPVGTGALATNEGALGWQSTNEQLRLYDGQRERGIGDVGWAPWALQLGHEATAAYTTSAAIAAAGGSLAIAMVVPGHMLLQSVTVRSRDTTLARTWGWDLYVQDLNNGNAGENTLRRVAACSANETFTAAAVSTRTLTAGSAPVYLAPGLYWLVFQNRHATNAFNIGSTATSAELSTSLGQSKTTTNPNGATLDFVAATWIKTQSIFAIRMNGRVFGEATGF